MSRWQRGISGIVIDTGVDGGFLEIEDRNGDRRNGGLKVFDNLQSELEH